MVAGAAGGQTCAVGSWGDLTYALGPAVIVLVIVALALVLRWAFSPGGSLIARPSRPGRPDDYGLLVPVAAPGSYIEGEIIRRRLEEAGLRATLAMTEDGPRVLVFPADQARAERVLARNS